MTAGELVYPVLGGLAAFVGFMAIGLLGFAMLHMIGRPNV